MNFYVRGKRYPGMEPNIDRWGCRTLWPEGEPGAIPDPTFRVIEDIENWKDVVKVPDLIGNCNAADLWEPYIARCEEVDREDKMLACSLRPASSSACTTSWASRRRSSTSWRSPSSWPSW